MAESVIERQCHNEVCMATRNGFFINVDAPHRLTAWVTVGMVLAVLSGCVTSPVYTVPSAKTRPDILQPCHEAE